MRGFDAGGEAVDRGMLVAALPVKRRSAGEHEIDLGEETRFANPQFRGRRAEVGKIVHRVVDR
jgi:hypothetical protein